MEKVKIVVELEVEGSRPKELALAYAQIQITKLPEYTGRDDLLGEERKVKVANVYRYGERAKKGAK